MPHAVVLDEYRAALVFLLTAGVIAPLFRRLKISPVIGYLVAGMALGPVGLGRVAWTAAFSLPDQDSIARLAEMGVVFLLFTIGLELSLERLKRMRRLVFGLGTLQVVVCAAAIGGIAMAFGTNANAAAIIGGALALSSTAIVIPVLAERKKLNSAAGRATFSVLLFQDLMIAPLLFMVAALSCTPARCRLCGGAASTAAAYSEIRPPLSCHAERSTVIGAPPVPPAIG